MRTNFTFFSRNFYILLINYQPRIADMLTFIMYTLQLLQPFNGLFSRTTWVSGYQKDKTNLDFTGARDSEWQWHQLGHMQIMQVCTSIQTDNHASTPTTLFLHAGRPSYRPTNSVKASGYPHRMPIPTVPQNPTYPYPHPVFSLQEVYFNLLFVTLTVGYYMMYVLRQSVCD